jgi:hypothetical protein
MHAGVMSGRSGFVEIEAGRFRMDRRRGRFPCCYVGAQVNLCFARRS